MAPGFFEVVVIVAPIFLIIGAGFLVRQLGLLTAEADASILRLLINVLLPCLALDVIVGNEALLRPENLFLPPLAGFLTVGTGYALAWWAAGRIGLQELRARRTFAFTTGIQNYGYFPLPLILTLFGRETAGVLFGFSLGVDICLWTVGLMMLTGKGGWRGIRQAINVPVVVIVLALGLNLAGAGSWIPEWIDKTWTMLAACAVPFALMLTGATFADFSAPSQLMRGKTIMVTSLIVRVGLLPLFILAIAFFLPVGPDLQRVLVVQAAMPAAVAPMAIARHYGGDATVGLKVVLASTVAGLITIPLWLQAGLSWLAGR